MKKIKALLALTALVAMVTVSSVAFAQQTVDVTTQVGEGATIAANCWNDASAPGTYAWETNSVALEQPGDRGGVSNDPAVTTASTHGWNVEGLVGTAVYTTLGGNPNEALTPENINAFGYGDCKVNVTTSSQIWEIDLKGGALVEDVTPTDTIPTMVGANTAAFDFTLDNEDPTYPYEALEAENGFYIAAASTGWPAANSDDGTAFGATYTTGNEKAYDAITCNGTRPCYHGLENTNGQVLYNNTTDGLSADEFVTRFGVGVLGGETPTATGSYTMEAIYTLTF